MPVDPICLQRKENLLRVHIIQSSLINFMKQQKFKELHANKAAKMIKHLKNQLTLQKTRTCSN